MNFLRKVLASCCALVCLGGAQTRRPIVPSDCVTVRHFLSDNFRSSLAISPRGTRVAYLVQSPNLHTNENDTELEVVDLAIHHGATRRLLAEKRLAAMKWLDDDHLTVLADREGRSQVLLVEVSTGRVSPYFAAAQNISEYSISAHGDTVVYAVEDPVEQGTIVASAAQQASGYRIPFEKSSVSSFYKRKVFLVRRDAGRWTKPILLRITSPGTRKPIDAFPYAVDLRLSLSPDGRYVALTYLTAPTGMPHGWETSPFIQTILRGINLVQLTPVIDLTTGQAAGPFASPWAYSVPLWSADSKSFIMTAVSPANSPWEADDIQHHRSPNDGVHLFEVNLGVNEIRMVRSELHGIYHRPLAWNSDGRLLLHTGDGVVTWMQYLEKGWQEVSHIALPFSGSYKNGQLAGNSQIIVGDYETPDSPPGLFLYRDQGTGIEKLTDLNPQFRNLRVAPIRTFEWQTSTGYHATGLLFMPPEYDAKIRYPLVIHSYAAASNFFCDSGFNHEPSFAPQPLANAGMMYLIRILPDGMKRGEEEAHYPKGYPGLLGEAAFQTDLWDSAVEKLVAEGLVDPARVGIIGFSRSGWYTEFALTHARTKFAAATAADNVQYSMGEYWLSHADGTLRGWDAMYGGPPYGETLRNWLDHSISFNLPKVRTPLLMEIMGYGKEYKSDDAPPSNLSSHMEVFSGLNRLGKPVELYYYPFEMHQPDHPLARLASLERNLAWYLFWLRGIEMPAPDDPDRYQRWRAMREKELSQVRGK